MLSTSFCSLSSGGCIYSDPYNDWIPGSQVLRSLLPMRQPIPLHSRNEKPQISCALQYKKGRGAPTDQAWCPPPPGPRGYQPLFMGHRSSMALANIQQVPRGSIVRTTFC